MEAKCTTCGTNVLSDRESVRFACPKCTEHEVIRCRSCRILKNRYECECGFVGP